MLTPVIGSEHFSHGALEKGTHLTIKLHSNPVEADSPTNDFQIPFFSDGGSKEWLKFCKNSARAFEGQNLATGPDQCAMTQSLNDVTQCIFLKCAPQQQKRWMQRQSHEPQSMKTHKFIARVTELNGHFAEFPMIQDDQGNLQKPSILPQDEKLDILEFGMPKSHQE